MVLYESGEFRLVIEEACNSGVVVCEELDDSWRTKDSWGVLMIELFNGEGTYITSDDNLLLFEWMS